MKTECLSYDLIVPFGMACSASQSLRRAGVQHLSFPFDWIVRQKGQVFWENDFSSRAELVRDGFPSFMDLADFEYHGEHTNGKAKYFNRRTGFVFLHDFPGGVPIERSIDGIRRKYARRIERLCRLLDASARILLCRLDRPDLGAFTTLEECRLARQIVLSRYPKARVDVVLLQCDRAIPFDNHRLECVEEGVYRLAFDYASKAADADPKIPDLSLTGAALAAHFSVRDYRTASEKKEHDKRKHTARCLAQGVVVRFGRFWRRLLGS